MFGRLARNGIVAICVLSVASQVQTVYKRSFYERVNGDGVVKTLHLLRHYKFAVVTTYLSTPHSIKFVFLEYEGFSLAI